MRLPLCVLPVVVLLLTGCASSFDVHHVPKQGVDRSAELGDKVLFYALPETIVTVDSVVEKKIVEDGPCKDFVKEKDFFGKDVEPKDYLGSEPAESKTKVTSVTIGSKSEPDPDRVYAIKLSRRWYQKLTGSFSLSESGILTNAEMTSENQAVDFAVTTLKTVAGLAVKLGPVAGGGRSKTECEAMKKEIDKLRETQRQIILGELNMSNTADGPGISVMLEKIAQREAQLVSKFIGTATVTTGTVHCELNPGDKELVLEKELFRIAKDGINASASTLCRVPSEIATQTAGDKKVKLKLTADRDQQLAGIAESVSPRPSNPSGLVFRIPASSTIEVFVDDDSKAVDRRQIAQFGLVTALPRSADVATFQSTVKAALYPGTGALQKLDFSGAPQGTGAVTGIAEAAGTILDARTAKEKEEAAAKDELAQLERKRKILEERKKILDLGGNPDEQLP